MSLYTIPHTAQQIQAPLVDLIPLAAQQQAAMRFDIQYAHSHNFTGRAVYPQACAFILDAAAHTLLHIAQQAQTHGYGLLIFDAYRPWHVTVDFWHNHPDSRLYLANPNNGSRHNRGCAIDLSLYHLHNGQAVDMPSAYDEFNEKAHLNYQGGTLIQRHNRELLQTLMCNNGFTNHPHEWWHFDYAGWEAYAVLDLSFAQLQQREYP